MPRPMTVLARLDALTVALIVSIAALGIFLGVGGAIAEWVFRQSLGLNVMHKWLEPVAVLVAVAGFFTLGLVAVPQAGTGWVGRAALLLAPLTLAVTLVGQQLGGNLAAGRSAFHPDFSLLLPLSLATIAASLAVIRALLAWPTRRTAVSPSAAGETTLLGFPPPGSTWLPALVITVAAGLLVFGSGDEGYLSMPQFAWNIVAGSDFGALAFTGIALALWQVGAAEERPGPQSVQVALLPDSVRHLARSLVPFGFLLYLLGLVAGVRLATLWAGAVVPLLIATAPAAVALLPVLRRRGAKVQAAGHYLPTLLLVAALALSAALVLFGFARPVEAAALLVLMILAGCVLRFGWYRAWGVMVRTTGPALHGLGTATLWVFAGALLFAAAGLLGWQQAIAQGVVALGVGPALIGWALLAVMLILGRWLRAPATAVLVLPVAVPALTALGGTLPWVVMVVALGSGLAEAVAAVRRPRDPASVLALLAALLAALALLAAPAWALTFARLAHFW